MTDVLQALVVEIDAGPDADDADLEEMRIQLRGELNQLEIESAEPLREGDAPPGTKALELIAAGTLLVKLAPAAIAAVLKALEAWTGRDKGRAITVTTSDGDSITLTGASKAERRDLIDAWAARQVRQAGSG